ncbi:hypothetical protein SAMN05660971_00450 [Halomonas cupida]|uniref:Uncharacterized protein n=1 Tax=Halomonas cupida TaxID=44933 RepID=A0A1M7AC86_9GAMM|nr:hypothetical protein SAMN05660971_00450 [Halomonas cupida]
MHFSGRRYPRMTHGSEQKCSGVGVEVSQPGDWYCCIHCSARSAGIGAAMP